MDFQLRRVVEGKGEEMCLAWGGGHKVDLISFYSHVDLDSDTRTHASINKSTVLAHIRANSTLCIQGVQFIHAKKDIGIPGKKKWTV